MLEGSTTTKIAHPFHPVKSLNSQLSFPLLDSMIHHKTRISSRGKVIVSYSRYVCKPYGVSQAHRLLPPQLIMKKHDYLRECLEHVLFLTPAQREVTFRLLRLWSYYGQVYPKEAQITAQPGCSKATFWRTISKLKALELVRVVNRYVIRPHAQISNLYLLDKLAVLLARYLAEHIAHAWPDWLKPALAMPLREFCRWLSETPEARAGPLLSVLSDP